MTGKNKQSQILTFILNNLIGFEFSVLKTKNPKVLGCDLTASCFRD